MINLIRIINWDLSNNIYLDIFIVNAEEIDLDSDKYIYPFIFYNNFHRMKEAHPVWLLIFVIHRVVPNYLT